jgi:DNA-binding transcriptional MocR family regulator
LFSQFQGGSGLRSAKQYKKEREHYTTILRNVITSPAFKALSIHAKALYPFIRLEWKGPRLNNNGRIQLSVRQAAELMNCHRDTAQRAFIDLQAKGFLVVRKAGALGLDGLGKSTEYEITEVPMPGVKAGGQHHGTRLYEDWKPGCDFEVKRAASSSRKVKTKPHPKKSDSAVPSEQTFRDSLSQELGHPVLNGQTFPNQITGSLSQDLGHPYIAISGRKK